MKNLLLLALLTTGPVMAKPLVIAHRGASGYFPEHTLPSAAMAAAMGADFIEPDLVLSKDSVLVVLHDIHLEATTDVRTKFPDRKRDDGRWYAIDFTLEELKTLLLHERRDPVTDVVVFPNRFPELTPELRIPTFADYLALRAGLEKTLQRPIGLYPEIKEPAFHRAEGKDISMIVLAALRAVDFDRADAPIYLQCFDAKEAKRIRSELGAKVKIVQLTDMTATYDTMRTYAGLQEVKTYANVIGPSIQELFSPDSTPSNIKVSEMVTFAHQLQLLIHPYTLRKDSLPAGVPNIDVLHDLVFKLAKVDGSFSDFTDLTRKYVDKNFQ